MVFQGDASGTPAEAWDLAASHSCAGRIARWCHRHGSKFKPSGLFTGKPEGIKREPRGVSPAPREDFVLPQTSVGVARSGGGGEGAAGLGVALAYSRSRATPART